MCFWVPRISVIFLAHVFAAKIISRDLELLEKLKQDAAEINSRKEQLAAEMKEIKATQTELEAKKLK